VEAGEDVLIRRAKEGDAEAFCRLAREYQRRVYTLALHFCRNAEDAEDLSQEVWLKAFKNIRGFRGESSFYTWLRHIVVNTFLNHRRSMTLTLDGERKTLRAEGLDAAEALSAPAGGAWAEDIFERSLLVGRVLDALGELTPQQRLVFLLKHREGLTYQEIADSFGCSAGTVKKSLFRTVLKLRAALGVEQEAGEATEAAGCLTAAAVEK
jgi:RNA polymerase sigma-70 factor (ECF subfamily)